MKKVLFVLSVVMLAMVSACEKNEIKEDEGLARASNQIESVDGSKINRPGGN